MSRCRHRHPLRLLAAVSLLYALLYVGIAGAAMVGAYAAADQAAPPASAPPASAPPAMGARPGLDRTAWRKHVCAERYARRTARMARLETRLQLTAQQRPLWANWQRARAATAMRLRDTCEAAVQGATPPTLPERETWKEKMLGIRLHGLQDSRAALQALYAALTPKQRAIVDRPLGGRGHFHMRRHDGEMR